MIKKIFCGITANLFAIFITMVAAIIRSSLAIRFLPATESGIWFLFWNIISLISFCDFGLSPTLSREIGLAFRKHSINLRVTNLFYTTKRLINIISLFTLGILIALGYFYFYHLSLDRSQLNTVIFSFALFSLAVVIQFQINPYLAVIYGLGNVVLERLNRAFSPVLGILVSLILVIKLKMGLYGLVIGYLGQVIIGYILARYFLTKAITLSKCGTHLKIIVQRIFEPALQFSLMSIGATLILQISNFLIGYLIGVKYIPSFAVLLQLSILVLTMASIIGYVITPYVSQAKGRGDIQMVHYFFKLSARISTAVAIMIALFFCFFADPIIRIWLGHGFVINHDALLLLLVMAILQAHHASCKVVTMASGYVKFAGITMLSGCLNLILGFIFIRSFGIIGAAFSIFLSQILTNNWYVIAISLKKLNFSFKRYFVDVLLPLVLFFMVLLVSLFFIHAVLLNILNIYLQLFSAIIITGLIFLICIWFILLSFAEKEFIKSKLKVFLYAIEGERADG